MLEAFSLAASPQGAEANLDQLTTALNGDFSWSGFFNAPPDADVLSAGQLWFSRMAGRRIPTSGIFTLRVDLMTARAFIGPAAQDMNLVYGPQGIVEISVWTGASHPS